MTGKKKKNSPILESARYGDLAAVREFLATGTNPNDQDTDGRTALHEAAIINHVEMVRMLLAAKANPNIQDASGWTALHFAAREQNTDIGGLLLDAGADVDREDRYGNTPLSNAVFGSRGRGAMISLLLSFGANKEKKNLNGVSPLDLAETIANYNVKQWLE